MTKVLIDLDATLDKSIRIWMAKYGYTNKSVAITDLLGGMFNSNKHRTSPGD